MKMKFTVRKMKNPRRFYRIVLRGDGLVDVWFSPGEAVPMRDESNGQLDYNIRVYAVQGIRPDDPQWGGNLEEHIRRHYRKWIASAEVIEI